MLIELSNIIFLIRSFKDKEVLKQTGRFVMITDYHNCPAKLF